MADIQLRWDPVNQRCDWTIVKGRLAAGADLESILLLLLFTDRRAQPGYVPTDGTMDLRGWWADSFEAGLIGSRLWQLDRRKITNRAALAGEAAGMVSEALVPMVPTLASAIRPTVTVAPAGVASSGSLMVISILVVLPTGRGQSFIYNYTLH